MFFHKNKMGIIPVRNHSHSLFNSRSFWEAPSYSYYGWLCE